MAKFEIKPTTRFRKDIKLMQKRGFDLTRLHQVVKLLADGLPLPESCRDHALSGNWSCYRECHIQPDWLLVYHIQDDLLVLVLTRTGTHSDLF
jgi:mRNA interferase YafQ